MYEILYGVRLKVNDGDYVQVGDEFIEGLINLYDFLRIKGLRGVQSYFLVEVQKVYKMQGVDINDKYIEIIIRQMMKKVKIEDSGDIEFLSGDIVEIYRFEEENDKVIVEGKCFVFGRRVFFGIIKAVLFIELFLFAVLFQEIIRVLIDAVIKGKVDLLIGFKENVIIGKLIFVGIGMVKYRNIVIEENQ